MIVQMDTPFLSGILIDILVSAEASMDLDDPSKFLTHACGLTLFGFLVQTTHFLFYTTLSMTFFDKAPINRPWPVDEPYLPPEDLTCHPISKLASTLKRGISSSSKV